MMNFKPQWEEYLTLIRPDLSEQSRKLYANQLHHITINNGLNDFNPLKTITRLVNKDWGYVEANQKKYYGIVEALWNANLIKKNMII